MTALSRRCLPCFAFLTLGPGCSGEQSVLAPGGPHAHVISTMFWTATIVSAAVLAAVMSLALLAMTARTPRWEWLRSEALVIWGGIVAPVVVLSGLLVYSVVSMPAGAAVVGVPPADFRIAVVGERWWWRVIYADRNGRQFESANEIHIPVGRRIEIELRSADVIHSFWVPALAGKLDMVPGRTNRLLLAAETPGISRGQCAEFCGGAHALMSFHVVAHLPEAHRAWLEREAEPARPPAAARDVEGQSVFLSAGCGACHAIRGTPADGRIGPDLTHLGSRRTLGAATLSNDRAAIARWIRDSRHLKPDSRMPPFGFFSATELDALSGYLAGLTHRAPSSP